MKQNMIFLHGLALKYFLTILKKLMDFHLTEVAGEGGPHLALQKFLLSQ